MISFNLNYLEYDVEFLKWGDIMALIKCPECEKEISDKAAACPHCGCPIDQIELPNNDTLQINEKKGKLK